MSKKNSGTTEFHVGDLVERNSMNSPWNNRWQGKQAIVVEIEEKPWSNSTIWLDLPNFSAARTIWPPALLKLIQPNYEFSLACEVLGEEYFA